MESQHSLYIAILSLGSNIGSEASHKIEKAIQEISTLGRVVKTSGIYATKPYGNPYSETSYNNAVIEVETRLPANVFIERCKEIELQLGRLPKNVTRDVAIDIDVVVWDGKVLRPGEMERDYFLQGFQALQ